MAGDTGRKLAVLFDMDGVIVDSMPYHFISWYEALRPLGVRVGCMFVYEKEGERWEKTLDELCRKSPHKVPAARLHRVFADKQRIFRKYFRRFIFDGARELLARLRKRGFATALVTSTPHAEVKVILPAALYKAFDTVVAGDMVGRGKPYPDPYLKAAAALGVRPRDCFVIENARLGIRSAKRAGMFCCALTTSLPREYLAGSDIVRETLAGTEKDILDFAGKRGRGSTRLKAR